MKNEETGHDFFLWKVTSGNIKTSIDTRELNDDPRFGITEWRELERAEVRMSVICTLGLYKTLQFKYYCY